MRANDHDVARIRLLETNGRTLAGRTHALVHELAHALIGIARADGRSYAASYGSHDYARFLDPKSFAVTRTIRVQDAGAPVGNLNELEWIGHCFDVGLRLPARRTTFGQKSSRRGAPRRRATSISYRKRSRLAKRNVTLWR